MPKVVADTGAWQLEIVKHTQLHNFVIPPKRARSQLRATHQHRRCIRPSRYDPTHAQTMTKITPYPGINTYRIGSKAVVESRAYAA